MAGQGEQAISRLVTHMVTDHNTSQFGAADVTFSTCALFLLEGWTDGQRSITVDGLIHTPFPCNSCALSHVHMYIHPHVQFTQLMSSLLHGPVAGRQYIAMSGLVVSAKYMREPTIEI